MKNRQTLLLGTAFILSACAAGKPVTHYTEVSPEPEVIERVVKISNPVPMPGQWKVKPKDDAKQKDITDPVEVIDTANEESTQLPEKDGMVNSIMVYDYMPGALYQIYAAPWRITSISLEQGENLISAAAGDTARWQLSNVKSGKGEVAQTHVLVKPTRDSLKTNLLISTDRRTYNLELSSYEDTYMASVEFNYPGQVLINTQADINNNDKKQKELNTKVNIDNLDFNYKIDNNGFHKYSWAPTRVYNDGAKTFIQFPKEVFNNELPVLFIESSDKETQLVNFRVKEDYVIVDKVFKRAQFRLGTQHQEVVTLEKLG